MLKNLLFYCFLFFFSSTFAQMDLTSALYSNYFKYRESRIESKRFKNEQLIQLISQLKNDNRFKVKLAGKSTNGKDIYLISIGSGKTKILAWSQMHGDESTATMAIFDLFNFFKADDEFNELREEILCNATIYFIPMLNPDGAEVFTRRNALQIDINRDALRLQTLEAKLLKGVRDSLNAQFGFNLHDQSTLYTSGVSERSATLSFLAPAFNYAKDINSVRDNTMKVIAKLYGELSKVIPGHIGRYNDDFEPRAFGDNMVKWGTSSVLIESGGWENDSQKQFIRKLNFIALITGLNSIATENYKNENRENYFKIPENERYLYDLVIRNATLEINGKNYIYDLGINRSEGDHAGEDPIYYFGRISEMGDMSVFYGYNDFDATGYKIIPGKVYPEEFDELEDLTKDDINNLLSEGYCAVRIDELDDVPGRTINLPINLVSEDNNLSQFPVRLGGSANFILQKDGKNKFAVINGFLYNISARSGHITNAIIYR